MKLFNLFCLLIVLLGINTSLIELESYSELELNKGLSEYIYIYSNSNSYNDKIPYIYIKLSNYEKTNVKIYLNHDEVSYYLTNKNEWINIPIKEQGKINITLKIEAKERNIKMIFIDSSKILKINLIKLLNLNFSINNLHKEPIPLLFNISVDTNIYFSMANDENSKVLILDDNNILSYFFQGVKYIYLMKDKTYKLKLNCYKDDNIYYFRKIKIEHFIEEIFVKNNTFIMHDFS